MTIKKILFLPLLWGYVLWRGKAHQVPKKITKVLVVQMAKLGDMVCTTPMFRAIKETYPEAGVYVLGNSINKEVVAYNKDVTGYIVFEGLLSVRRRLTQEKFEAVVVAGAPDFFSAALAFLAGVPLVVGPRVTGGYAPQNDIWYRSLSSLITTTPHAMGSYAPREYLRLLEPLGIRTEDAKKHLAYSDAARKVAEAFVVSLTRPLIGITPSAGNKVKEWSADRFAAVADELARKHNATVIIFGSKRDEAEVQAMLGHTKETHINALNKFSIDELKAVIAKLDLFISVDTGPIYIAEAFNIPTVDITGPIDEREQPPIGERHLVVTPPGPRVPQLSVLNAKQYDYAEARRQAESISIEAVIEGCDRILSSNK